MSEQARQRAAQRAAELTRRRAELETGQPVTSEDIDNATQHAEQAKQRAENAHLSAAQRHQHAADAHERTAEVHDRAASEGVGDIAAHKIKAQEHRRAATADREAAARDYYDAECDLQR